MSLAYINLKHKESSPELWLCKPDANRTTVRKLNDIFGTRIVSKTGAINELTFNVPLYVERNHEQVKNPVVDLLNGYYEVKVKHNNKIEYFTIINSSKQFNNDGHTLSYKLYSSAYILNKKIIREYEEVSKTLRQHITEFLRISPSWSIDFIDSTFDLQYRTIEIGEATVLEAIMQAAEKYQALVVWDTLNKKVNFYKPGNIGVNKGLQFKEGVGLENFNVETDFNQIVTRLQVYGEDGLEFRRLSPTGSNYIESFDWFIYPFEQDAQGNVIKHSKYMSDELCIAIRKYEAKVQSATGQFESLTTQLTNAQNNKQQREQELSVLDTELRQIENELWVLNKTIMEMYGENELSQIRDNTDVHPISTIRRYEADRNDAIARKNNKQFEIDAKKSQITTIDNQITGINNQINALRLSLAVENNYTIAQLKELDNFIHVQSYTNDSIVDEDDLLADGIEAFKKVNQPPIRLNISLANFLEHLDEKFTKNRIVIGDIIRFKSLELDEYIEARIIEIIYDVDNQSYSLTIANEKDLKDDWQILRDRIYNAGNTSTTVNLDRYRWNEGQEALDEITKMREEDYDAAKNAITAGYMDLTTLDRFGLKSYEYNNSDVFLFINNGILGITADNLNTIEVAISKRGISANLLNGRVILSNKVVVEDALGVIEMHSGLQQIFDNQGRVRVQLGRYPDPDNNGAFKYGLRVYDGAIDIRTSDNENRGVQLDGNGFRAFNNNGVRTFDVDAATGQVSIVGGIRIKTHPDNLRGTEIDGDGFRIYGNGGQIVFSADHFGNVYYAGRLSNATGTVSNLGGTLDDMGGKFIGSIDSDGTFRGLTTGTLSAQTVSTISLHANQITAGTISSDRINTQSLQAATVDVDQLRANNAQITNLSSISSDLGNITGGRIDIDTDMTIGRNLYLGGTDFGGEYTIQFARSAGITYNSDTIAVTAIGSVTLEATRIYLTGQVFVNGNPL